MSRIPPTELNRYRVRFLAQLLTEASADYWQRRAAVFDAARPRTGDFTGSADPAALAALDQRCRDTAEACRAHAALITAHGLPDAAREALAALSHADPPEVTPQPTHAAHAARQAMPDRTTP